MVEARHRLSGRLLLVSTTLLLLIALLGLAGFSQASAAQERGRDGHGGRCASAARLTFRALENLQATLSDLVRDGTLTQEQSDTVAASLADGEPGGIAASAGGGIAGRCASIGQSFQTTMQTVSDLLGLEWPEIRDRLRTGESLAEIAESEGVSRDELIAALQAGSIDRLDDAEAAGRITPDERAEREEAVLARIERLIDRHPGNSESETESSPGTPASDSR